MKNWKSSKQSPSQTLHEWKTCILVTYRHTSAAHFAGTSFYFELAAVSSNFLPLSQNQGLSSLPDSVGRCGSTSSTPHYFTVHRARLFSRFKCYLLEQESEKALKSAQHDERWSLPGPPQHKRAAVATMASSFPLQLNSLCKQTPSAVGGHRWDSTCFYVPVFLSLLLLSNTTLLVNVSLIVFCDKVSAL